MSTKSAEPELGLGGILGPDPRALGLKSLDDPAEERILIRSRDGGTEWIRVSEQPWWEELEAKQLREYERKAMPVQIASFEV